MALHQNCSVSCIYILLLIWEDEIPAVVLLQLLIAIFVLPERRASDGIISFENETENVFVFGLVEGPDRYLVKSSRDDYIIFMYPEHRMQRVDRLIYGQNVVFLTCQLLIFGS